VPPPGSVSWSSASRAARPGLKSPKPVPTDTSTAAPGRPSRSSSAHGITSVSVLAAASPAAPKRSWP